MMSFETCLLFEESHCVFFWCGLPNVARRILDVGFVVRTAPLQSTQEIPFAMDERLVTLWLPLAKDRFATFVSDCAPTLDFHVEVGVIQGCVLPQSSFIYF